MVIGGGIISFLKCFYLVAGPKWFKRRKILTPAFHFKVLEQYVESFDRQGDILIENLQKCDPNDNVEFYKIATLYALDVICGNL